MSFLRVLWSEILLLPLVGTHRFLLRLRAPLSSIEAQRTERVLATARLFLGSCALFAVLLDPTEPREYSEQAYLLLIFYLLYCLVVLLFLRLRQESTREFRVGVHAVDIVWAGFITLFTAGPASPFFVFFVFVLLAAAYRWGFPGALLTAAAAILVLFLESIPAIWPVYIGQYLETRFHLNRYVLLGTYLFVMAVLLGYVAEAEKLLRSETSAIGRIMRKTQEETTLARTIHVISDEVLRIFGSNQGLFLMRETATDRVFLWEATRKGEGHDVRLRTSEVEDPRRDVYFFVPAAHSLRVEKKTGWKGGGHFEILALNTKGKRLSEVPADAPKQFHDSHPFRSFLCVSFTSGEEWSGRFFILDPSKDADGEEGLGFFQALLFQLTPAVYSVYLLGRIRTRIGAKERTRVARELHDGPIQSLIALEMRVEVLRRHAERDSVRAEEIGRVQHFLRQEVLDLRELMQRIKPLDVGAKQLLGFLSELVDRFQRETGISARFLPELEVISLPPRACREVARILQEALVNVRKHSSAKNVIVRFASQNGRYRLEIDDDGRGFDFSGRYNQAQLDAIQKGPMVIKERVRSIGGELVIESAPGKGVRLEIEFPAQLYG
ncbi:MAG: hypothetical protein DMG10_26645 [Acidobacteria bacterium]|nr:MAG: hypothetical protein DMG10_26645 [Acidobacteriota bacterium]